jgi:hypothetical protein
VRNIARGPFGPNDKPDLLISVIVPGAVYQSLPKPK